MTLRKTASPSFTLEDYHRLDMLETAGLLNAERERLRTFRIDTLRKLLVECGIEESRSDTAYWSKDDMVQAIAEHRVLVMEAT